MMMKSLIRCRYGWEKFQISNSAIAAVEFALILPIMLLFILGGFETVRAITCARKLTFLTNAIVQQVTSNPTNQVNNADMHFFYNTTIPVFPQTLKDAARNGNNWYDNIGISVSSITFTPTPVGCTSACTYLPSVLWSIGNYRSCIIPILPASSQATPSATTLPVDVYGPGSIIVVDVVYTYHTVLSGSFISNYIPSLNNIVIRRSAYSQPRYNDTIYYHSGTGIPGNDGFVTWCAGNQST